MHWVKATGSDHGGRLGRNRWSIAGWLINSSHPLVVGLATQRRMCRITSFRMDSGELQLAWDTCKLRTTERHISGDVSGEDPVITSSKLCCHCIWSKLDGSAYGPRDHGQYADDHSCVIAKG